MADNEPDSSPAGDALREEVGRIMADPEWGRNPALSAKVGKLYEDAYGKAKVDLSDGVTVVGSDEGQRPGSTEDAGAASPEDAEADTRAIAQLHDEWSDRFDTNMEDARQGLTALSTTLGAGADDLIGAYLEAGGDRAVGIKALATYGQGRKT